VTHHLAHVLMLGLPVCLFALLFAAEWRRTADSPLPRSLWVAASGSIGASVVHAVVMPHHLHEAAVLGWFFALLSLGQLAWVVVLLLRPRHDVVVAGVLANLAVVVLWAWTRTVGVPFGVAGGARERVGAADLTATGLEVLVVLGGLVWAYGASPQRGRAATRALVGYRAEPVVPGT
jgi:hypothetical protein